MSASLVGSEMCIRDSRCPAVLQQAAAWLQLPCRVRAFRRSHAGLWRCGRAAARLSLIHI
eukprot:1953341-Alexandrium_andersonii.AAC.1